ncbi:MAG: helix-turn-helix transcriptional regulator, partial [Agromyces sp.]
YRLVPVARRWYLLAWDRQREDWRTFRLDRMSDVFPTRVRFEPRPMSDDDARARVEAAVRWRDRSVKARVVAEMPQADLVEHLGWYGREVVAVDAGHCAWPIEADSVENLSMALMWMPRGVRYRVEAAPEVLDFLAMQAERFAEASARG